MSMFHELMMRKKEQIMYATIKGTLTENDGVFSGFSNANNLQINSGISVGQKFEIYTKFTTGASLSSNQELIAGKISSDLYLRIFIQNGATLFTSARVVGASSISHNQTSYSFQTNTTYSVKVKYDGANKLDVFIYDNTGQQVKTNSFTLSNQINTFNYFLIGSVGTTSSVWGGSIDLNNSYIKLGSTKYNLQAVVGYTVVGSPTITDGVVSGFGASDYLALSQRYSGAYPSGKIAFTYDRQSSMNQILLVMQRSTLFPFRIRAIDRTLQISWVDSDNTQQSIVMSYSLVVGVYYSVTWEVKAGKIYFTLFDSLGNILETKNQDASLEATTSGAVKIGWYSSSSYWQGSIDLNNTYIKDGNKLWFNGQQV